MIANAWKWADQQAGRKRVNEVHGEEEIRIVLKDTFLFMDEEGDLTEQAGSFDVEDKTHVDMTVEYQVILESAILRFPFKLIFYEDENGTLFESDLPNIAANDEKLLESLGAPPETTPQAAVTGGGAFKHPVSAAGLEFRGLIGGLMLHVVFG